MKKAIIIILAIILILVGGIWLYLLLFGAPESTDELFSDLGFGGVSSNEIREVEPTPDLELEDTFEDTDNVPEVLDSSKLKRLTTRPVAGATIVGTSTADQVVRYVEQGIGHIYEVSLPTGNERKLSGTTFSGITDAVVSPDGDYVVMIADSSLNPVVKLYYLGEEGNLNESGGEILPPDTDNFSFSDDGSKIYYTRSDEQGTLGYVYTISAQAGDVIFSVPFSHIKVFWENQTIIYNKPSELHPGYVYTLDANNELQSVTNGGVALTAFASDGHVVVNKQEDNGYRGKIVTTNGQTINSALFMLPDKCAGGVANQIWCGGQLGPVRGSLPNDWYKGLLSFKDELWTINLDTGEATLAESLTDTSGTTIDITDMQSDYTETRIIFTNKNTNYLWFYDSATE